MNRFKFGFCLVVVFLCVLVEKPFGAGLYLGFVVEELLKLEIFDA